MLLAIPLAFAVSPCPVLDPPTSCHGVWAGERSPSSLLTSQTHYGRQRDLVHRGLNVQRLHSYLQLYITHPSEVATMGRDLYQGCAREAAASVRSDSLDVMDVSSGPHQVCVWTRVHGRCEPPLPPWMH